MISDLNKCETSHQPPAPHETPSWRKRLRLASAALTRVVTNQVSDDDFRLEQV